MKNIPREKDSNKFLKKYIGIYKEMFQKRDYKNNKC